MYFGKKPYDLNGYIKHYGDGSNMYRAETFAQPRTLSDGDVLSNGWEVSGDTFSGYNDSVGINFTNGLTRIVPPRLALQLQGRGNGILPHNLRIGQILQTGCVVLDRPKRIGRAAHRQDQEEVMIRITGPLNGHSVDTPSDLELAVYDEEYPPSMNRKLGAFALERVLAMDDSARVHLPELFDC